jgi:RimJ/RimL family protein N-acetyltransferase
MVASRDAASRARTASFETTYGALPIRSIRGQDGPAVSTILQTDRLVLVPITIATIEAIFAGRRDLAEAAVGAPLPEAWPGRALVERAFRADLDAIRADPTFRLWGDRVMITRQGPKRVVGSVVFHGGPDGDGIVEVGYGVERDSQRQGFATEATRAAVEWACGQPGVRRIRATTPSWHVASRKVLERCGLELVGQHEHDVLGELLDFERKVAATAMLAGVASPP